MYVVPKKKKKKKYSIPTNGTVPMVPWYHRYHGTIGTVVRYSSTLRSTLPERTSQKRTRNKTHAKENVGRSTRVAVSRVEDALGQLQRQPSHHVGQRRFMRHRKKRPQPSPSRSTFTTFKIRFTSHLTVCAKAHKKLQAHILVPSSQWYHVVRSTYVYVYHASYTYTYRYVHVYHGTIMLCDTTS